MRFTTIAIKHVVLAGVAAIEIVTAGAFLLAFYFYADRAAERHTLASIHWALDAVEQELALFFGKVETVADVTLGLAETEILDFNNQQALERYFFKALQASPRFTGMYYGGMDGSFVFVTREAPGLEEGETFVRRIVTDAQERVQTVFTRDRDFSIAQTPEQSIATYDPRERPWFSAALADEGLNWSDPYIFYTSGQPGVTVSSRILSPVGGEVIGVIGLDLSFSELSSFVLNLDISTNGKAFITDEPGRLIAFPGFETPADENQSALPNIISLEDSPAAEAFRLAGNAPDRDNPILFEWNGNRYTAAFSTLDWDRGEWVVGAFAPKQDFMTWFADVKRASFWLTLILMTAGMFGGWTLWRTIRKRLLQIEDGAQRMMDNTGDAFSYETSGFKELQTTEKALSVMAKTVVDRETKLRQLNEKLAEVMRAVDRMPIGIALFSPHENVRYTNAVAATVLGFQGDGQDVFDNALIQKLEREDVANHDLEFELGGSDKPLSEALNLRETWEGEFTNDVLHGGDGKTSYRVIISPLAPRSANRWILAIEDISIQKRMEHNLVHALETATEASQAKSMFLANMSHELRTPLNSVLGYSDMIKSEIFGPIGDPRYAGYIDNISESGHALLEILSNLLDLTAIESGRMTLKADREHLSKIIEDAAYPHRTACRSAGFELQTTIDDDIYLQADGLKLRQAIGNLVQNAAHYASSATLLTINAHRTGKSGLEIVVEDNGTGISEARFERVLQPFRRSVDDSHLAAADGVGLGLPIAKAIIELHGGTLRLATAECGHGLRVVMSLPLVD